MISRILANQNEIILIIPEITESVINERCAPKRNTPLFECLAPKVFCEVSS